MTLSIDSNLDRLVLVASLTIAGTIGYLSYPIFNCQKMKDDYEKVLLQGYRDGVRDGYKQGIRDKRDLDNSHEEFQRMKKEWIKDSNPRVEI